MRRIKFSLIKMIQRHQEVFKKYKNSVVEVMKAIVSKYKLKHQKSNIFFYIRFCTLHIFLFFLLFIYSLYTVHILFIFSHKFFSTRISIYLYIFMFVCTFMYFYRHIKIIDTSIYLLFLYIFLCFVYLCLC